MFDAGLEYSRELLSWLRTQSKRIIWVEACSSEAHMGFLQQEPERRLLLDDLEWVLDCQPEIPENAYPPVIEGHQHPLMILDDVALDLYGAASPAGYTGFWVISEGHLYLRWLLGRTGVRWDLKADWFTGYLYMHPQGDAESESSIHIDHGDVWPHSQVA